MGKAKGGMKTENIKVCFILFPGFNSSKKAFPVSFQDYQHLLSGLGWELLIILECLNSMVQGVITHPSVIIKQILTDVIITFIVKVFRQMTEPRKAFSWSNPDLFSSSNSHLFGQSKSLFPNSSIIQKFISKNLETLDFRSLTFIQRGKHSFPYNHLIKSPLSLYTLYVI